MTSALLLTLVLCQSTPASNTPDGGVAEPPKWTVELSTLQVLHARGLLSDEEYESATADVRDALGLKAPDGNTLMVSRFALTAYGFIQANAIYDTTQSYNEQEGNAQVARPDTYGGRHDRFQLSARHSRFGFRLKAPEVAHLRATALFEMDFLGTQLPVGAGQPGTELALVANPTFRARHLYLKVETPWVDLIAGQFWPVFGGQPSTNPNAVEIQGIPGQLYSRMPQVRLSRAFKGETLQLDLAVAAVRSPQRDSGLPDGQAAVRLSLPRWVGFSTGGATASGPVPASLTLSGDLRSIRLPAFVAAPLTSNAALGAGAAADLVLPLVRGRDGGRAGALTLTAEGVWGHGTADLYSGLNGGVTFPTLPGGATWSVQDIDNGIATYDANGKLTLIDWLSAFASLQYYLPVLDGRLWFSAIYSHLHSPTTGALGGAKLRDTLQYASFAVFADPLPAFRVGLEYAASFDHFVDGTTAVNHRVNLALYYLF